MHLYKSTRQWPRSCFQPGFQKENTCFKNVFIPVWFGSPSHHIWLTRRIRPRCGCLSSHPPTDASTAGVFEGENNHRWFFVVRFGDRSLGCRNAGGWWYVKFPPLLFSPRKQQPVCWFNSVFKHEFSGIFAENFQISKQSSHSFQTEHFQFFLISAIPPLLLPTQILFWICHRPNPHTAYFEHEEGDANRACLTNHTTKTATSPLHTLSRHVARMYVNYTRLKWSDKCWGRKHLDFRAWALI